MPLTNTSTALTRIQKGLRAFLAGAGFQPDGRTFRRQTGDHLVHVINLQAGRPAPPSKAVTGLVRTDLGGKFTVNLGVYLPGVARLRNLKPPAKGPLEYDCQLRARLGELLSPPRDQWWPIALPTDPVVEELTQALRAVGLPFLDRYQTREGLILRWPADAAGLHLANDARVVVALQLYDLGRSSEAAEALQEQYDDSAAHPQHRGWLVELATSLGLPMRISAV